MTITLDELRELAKGVTKNSIHYIYLHWTAGYYETPFWDYHINIGADGEIILTCDSLDEKKSHTWNRNTGSIGIALDCCVGAVAYNGTNADYGINPPTEAQIESLARVVAVLTEELELPMDNVMTHQEIASIDGYGPYSGDPETRWDLWYLTDYYQNIPIPGGSLIRGKAYYYLAHKGS